MLMGVVKRRRLTTKNKAGYRSVRFDKEVGIRYQKTGGRTEP